MTTVRESKTENPIQSNNWNIPQLLEKTHLLLNAVRFDAKGTFDKKYKNKDIPLLDRLEKIKDQVPLLDRLAWKFIEKIYQSVNAKPLHYKLKTEDYPVILLDESIPYNKLLRQSVAYNSLVFKTDPYDSVPVETSMDPELNTATEAAYYLTLIRTWLINKGKLFAENLRKRYEELFQIYGVNIPGEYVSDLQQADELINQFQFVCSPQIPDLDEAYTIEDIKKWAKSVWNKIDTVINKEADAFIGKFNYEHPNTLLKNALGCLAFQKGEREEKNHVRKLPHHLQKMIFSFTPPRFPNEEQKNREQKALQFAKKVTNFFEAKNIQPYQKIHEEGKIAPNSSIDKKIADEIKDTQRIEHKNVLQFTLDQCDIAIEHYQKYKNPFFGFRYLFSSEESLCVGRVISDYFGGKTSSLRKEIHKLQQEMNPSTEQKLALSKKQKELRHLPHLKTAAKSLLEELKLGFIKDQIDQEQKLSDEHRYLVASVFIKKYPKKQFSKELNSILKVTPENWLSKFIRF